MNDYKALLLVMLWLWVCGACTNRDDEVAENTDRLRICVAQRPFTADGVPLSRMNNHGFLSSFEDGDAIGVTAIGANDSVLPVCNNVKFTYRKRGGEIVEDGVTWYMFENDQGYSFVEKVNGARYFAYYPYNQRWNGKTLDEIIAEFDVADDQHTKESFTQSDLMTPAAPIAPGNGELRFTLDHQMATISLFYNNEWEPDGSPKYKIVLTDGTLPAGFTVAKTFRSTTGVTNFVTGEQDLELRHRYLVNPRKLTSVKLVGWLEESSHRFFSYTVDSVKPGYLYSISFEGEPLVPYTDGVDLKLDSVPFLDKDNKEQILGHTVIWSKYNLGESLNETYPYPPAANDRGEQKGTKDPMARGDYYAWAATFTQYDDLETGYKGYGYYNYFDKEYMVAPLGGTIKETEYDVAHAIWWRGKWRMPTENEFRAMYAGCTFEKVATYSDTNARYIGAAKGTTERRFSVIKVTSKQDTSRYIYMSTGGYTDGTMEPTLDANGNATDSGDGKVNAGVIYPGTAYYLTSNASPNILRAISYAYFNETSQQIKVDGSRYTGMLVRPVYSPNEKKNDNK